MDWETLRTDFPTTARWAFLDHAAVAPLPAAAVRALIAYAEDYGTNGVASYHRWAARVSDVRRLAARLLNADPDDIAFVANTTAGLGIVAEGVRWLPGDNVVTATEEYPSNQYPWLNLAERGVEVRRVASRGNRLDLSDIAAAINDRTRVVSLSWVQFASGYRLNLDAVGELCRSRNVLFCVDAIQGLGVFPLDVTQTPIDFLAADGHKWLLGPEGCGVFYARREAVEQLHPTGVGWNSVVGWGDFSTIDFQLKPHAGRFEGGSLNIPGITALGASLDVLLKIGIRPVSARILQLTGELCDRAMRFGVKVFSSRLPDEASGIVSLDVANPAAMANRCREAGVIVAVRGGRLRVSPHCYNSTDDLARLMDVLRGQA